MQEDITISRCGDIFSIFTSYRNDDGHEVHLVYDSENFYFESINYLNEDYEDFELEDYSTCTEEEFFQYSTVYPYSQYLSIEKLSAIQKIMLNLEKSYPVLDSTYEEDYNVSIQY